MKYHKPEVYISKEKIAEKVKQLGEEITDHYKGQSLVVVSITNGALIFAADLIRAIDLPLQLDSIMMASYAGTQSSGKVQIRSELKLQLEGQHVLVVDEILDTGRTLHNVKEIFSEMNPASLKFCVLLDKPECRKVDIQADYAGFEIPDEFVIGYGLDYNEFYRNLPYIGIYKPD